MQFLRNWSDIARVFGVTQKEAHAWRAMGAPILIVSGKPLTYAGDLWRWLLANRETIEKRDNLISAHKAKQFVDDTGEVALSAAILLDDLP